MRFISLDLPGFEPGCCCLSGRSLNTSAIASSLMKNGMGDIYILQSTGRQNCVAGSIPGSSTKKISKLTS